MQLAARSMIAAAALVPFGAASAACPPPVSGAAEVSEVCIDLICIEGDELQLYQAMETDLATEMGLGLMPGDEVEVVRRSLLRIDVLPLHERFRWSLAQKLSRSIADRSSPPHRLVLALVDSSEPELQDVGLAGLFALDGALGAQVRSSLLATLREPATPTPTRQALLWWFHRVGAFAEVEDAALDLARRDSEPELAHAAAQVLLQDLSQRPEGTDRILKIYRSGTPILRSRAALVILEQGLAHDSPALGREAAQVAGDLAKDPTQPPSARGEAIEALSLYGDAGKQPNRSILLELLDHRYWFFGASGAHFPVHSLAPVIWGLRATGDPEITRALAELRPLLPALRSGEREYVEWVLDNALGVHREIFYGPVDPDR